MSKLPPLGDITVERFLADYWQKDPVVIRGALADFEPPLTPEEFGGLALEEDVESRLIQEQGGDTPWQVRNGPFSEDDLTSLPDTHWTLLVQEINKHVPEFALLQDRFNFIPNWRLDDVMVSFAPEHGSVGPHADNYDVFIIQGSGRRRWQINRNEPTEADLIPDLPLRIMHNFQAEEEWILEPGDMLYIPPGVAHHGVALEDSLSYSVGYRAPTLGDLLSGFYGEAIAAQATESFYSDPDLPAQSQAGEISLRAREAIRRIIRSLATDDAAIDHWFGRYITDIRPGHTVPEPEQPLSFDTLKTRLEEVGELWRSEYCRYAHMSDANGQLSLYVAGEEYPIAKGLLPAAQILTQQRVFSVDDLAPYLAQAEFQALLVELFNFGCLYFPDDEFDD